MQICVGVKFLSITVSSINVITQEGFHRGGFFSNNYKPFLVQMATPGSEKKNQLYQIDDFL